MEAASWCYSEKQSRDRKRKSGDLGQTWNSEIDAECCDIMIVIMMSPGDGPRPVTRLGDKMRQLSHTSASLQTILMILPKPIPLWLSRETNVTLGVLRDMMWRGVTRDNFGNMDSSETVLKHAPQTSRREVVITISADYEQRLSSFLWAKTKPRHVA